MSPASTEHLPVVDELDGSSAVDDTKSQASHESILETTLDLPSLKPATLPSRLRRRSDRPSSTLSGRPVIDVHQAPFELSAVPPHILVSERSRPRSDANSILEEALPELPGKGGEPETLPPSYSTTPTASVRMEQFEVDDHSAVSPAERARQKRNHWLHFGAVCWTFWLNGWHDGSTGPLIPVLQRDYKVNFTVVSLIFVSACCGYLIGATTNIWLTDRAGFGKAIAFGAVIQMLTYVTIGVAGLYSMGFPFIVIGYAFGGFSLAIQNAQGCGFVGSMKDSKKMGFLQAFYGIGAFCSPLVATQFSTQRHWSFHYLVSFGLAATNVIALITIFRFRTQDQVMADAGIAPGETDSAGSNKYRQLMGIRAVHLIAIWALLYVGIEVTLGGWIVTFIIEERHGDETAGYISSGFFGGLALGRVILMGLNHMVGEHRIIFVYTALVIALEITIWVVPSLIQNAVAVSVIGLFLGPMYPILMNQTARIIPRWLLTGAVGWIAGIGQAGSALLPFLTGVLAANFGIGSLQPLLVSMMVVLFGLWVIIPKGHTRVD